MNKSLLAFVSAVILLGTFWLGSAGDAPRAISVTVSGAELDRAERLVAEGSYSLAHEIYDRLRDSGPAEDDRRWVEMRWADTLWRSESATSTADSSRLDRARTALEVLNRDVTRSEDRDRVWAEAEESLGDFWWARQGARNWGQGFAHYQLALTWWGASQNIDLARQRYLDIVWKSSRPPWVEPYYVYGGYGNRLPLQVLYNAVEIAEAPDDSARAHYLLAMTLMQSGGVHDRRVADAFDAALAAGRTTEWYDDALYHYAQWLGRAGKETRTENGQLRREPDFPAAVEVYRRLTREYAKGETRYYDDAIRTIEQITAAVVEVAVSSFFLPDSEIQFFLTWRNVDAVDLALYRVDLTSDVRFADNTGSREWLSTDLPTRTPMRSWTRQVEDRGDHVMHREAVALGDPLPRGAYLLEAKASGVTRRELVLVTGSALVLKTTATEALVWVADALRGTPREGADIALSVRTWNGNHWGWQRLEARSDADGLARVTLPESRANREIFVAAASGDDQAFGFGRGSSIASRAQWKIYAYTDRPAYRPGDEARFKVVARRYDGATYSTPAGETIRYEIRDPRGAEAAKGELELNDFGSAWDRLALTAEHPLGEYHVTFFDAADHTIGSAMLLRLEEYKLPEFSVAVETPRVDGKPVALRVGDPVEARVTAEYYFGGPVADAAVEVVVYHKPLWVRWHRPREFPWFYDETASQRYGWGGPGQVVHRETLRTDSDGVATVTFDTPQNSEQDLEYTVEARVTDASRREISGSGSIRASRQRYFVFPSVEHHLYRPGDDVRVDFKTVDANEQPFPVEGMVTVTRERWVEVWIDPRGREVAGSALDRLRERTVVFPPTDDPGWRVKSQGYEREEILRQIVRTGEDGEAGLDFTPGEVGYYRVAWDGDDGDPYPVRGETTVWVAERGTVDVGYHHGGVGIILDRDTFEAGKKAHLMLTAPVRGAYVLFTVEGDDLYEVRVVHMSGTVKLVELDLDERHTPNIYLDAAMIHGGKLHLASQQVIVPPVDHFLDVEITSDSEEYRPRQEGVLNVTTRDHDGNPVSAEVSLAVIDESVLYIQKEYAQDPRQFFYGTKRGKRVQLSSTFQIKPYVDLVLDEDNELSPRELDQLRSLGYVGGRERDFGAYQGSRPQAGFALADSMVAAEERMEGDVAKKEMRAMDMAQAPAPSAEAGGAAGQEPAVQVRSDFRATALWEPSVVTSTDGTAEIKVTFPDTLTTWKATARVATRGNRFGTAEAASRTSKPLIVRVQAPRFFVVGDTVTISAVINNKTAAAMSVRPELTTSGLEIVGAGAADPVPVPAGGEHRLDWTVEVREPGEAHIEVVARGDGSGPRESDAMARDYPVYAHGIDKLVARSGKLRGDEADIVLDLPRERAPGSTSMVVQVTPSLAVTLLDALPYLIDYPYGCTEQTMSRFLPAAITARTLEQLGMQPRDIAGRMFGGIESATASATHPGGARDLGELDAMVRKGLTRLYDFQHGDGGWGWWKDGDSDHFMTAYVVWGLGLARDAGIKVRDGVIDRGANFLRLEMVEREDDPNLQAFMLHAVASIAKRGPSHGERKAFDNLWDKRDRLNAYGRALLALSAHAYGDDERATVLVRNLENGVKRDDSADTSSLVPGRGHQASSMGTAHWGADGVWWRWSDGPVETTSFVLRALSAIDPGNALIEPTANWLIKNRRGAQWSNTRDSAMAVLTLGDYLETSGELASSIEYELHVNGETIATRRVTPKDVLSAPSRFEIDPARIADGANRIEVVRLAGEGPLYFSAEARFVSLEEPIAPEGNEIFVERRLYKLVGHPTLLSGYVYETEPLEDGDTVKSGERVRVVLTVEAKNDYEYLVFEDLKAAGLETVQIRSGEPLYARELRSDAFDTDPAQREDSDFTERTRWIYQELRDRKVAMFVDKLPQGRWEIRYDLRAETPGTFHALPTLGHAMYVPEIRCNGAEQRLTVEDR